MHGSPLTATTTTENPREAPVALADGFRRRAEMIREAGARLEAVVTLLDALADRNWPSAKGEEAVADLTARALGFIEQARP